MAMKESAWGLDISWLCNLYWFASANSDEPNGCIRSFLFNLCKILNKQKPTFLVAAIDSHLSFRKELEPTYKGTRKEKEEGFILQLNEVKSVIDALGIPAITVDYFEADDVLATLAEEAKVLEIPFVAVINDKDFFQKLVKSKVGMYNKPKGADWRFFGQLDAEKKWNIKIEQSVCFQTLCGDVVDSIKGCPSIGPKRASQLLNEFNSIEGIYENLDKVPEKLRPNLEKFRERLATVRKLVTLDSHAGNFSGLLEDYSVENFKVNKAELHKILVRNDLMNLQTLLLETFHA